MKKRSQQLGSALISVLWLAAAMSAITLALAATVRSEAERAEADSEGLRTYYLAQGSVDRALLWMHWGSTYRRPDGTPMFYDFPTPRFTFRYPSGVAIVELIPESAKYNINTIQPEALFRLILTLGAPEQAARDITSAILDWRQGSPSPGASPFDSFYLSQPSSFRSPHASIRELEELMLIRGITPDLFYGHYTRDAEGHAAWHSGLRDCLTSVGSDQGFDINTVEPAVLATLGVTPFSINAIADLRARGPIRSMDQVNPLLPEGAGGHLRIGGGSLVTLRATARLLKPDGKLSDLKRSVAALVKLERAGVDPEYSILRWYDNAQSGIL